MWFVIVCTFFSVVFMFMTILSMKNKRKRLLASRLPGPDGFLMNGYISLIIRKRDPETIVKVLTEQYRKYEKEPIGKFWIFNRLFIVLSSPELMEIVLKNPKYLKKSSEYSLFDDFFGGILSNNNLDEWKHNRKLVVRGLGPAILKSLIPTFYQEAKVLVEVMQEERDLKSNDCDISTPIKMATMENIGKTALGVTFNTQKGGRHNFVEAVNTLFEISYYRFLNPWFMNNILFHLSPLKRDHDRCVKIGREFIDGIIKSKIVESKCIENSANVNLDDENYYKTPKTMIEILVQQSHEMSLTQIRKELMLIITAGQDTTAMATSITVFMLAHHPDVQNKVFEELQSIFLPDDPERPPTYDDLQKMNYLERVIKEVLRMYPSVPLFARSIEEEIELGSYLCPAGATLVFLPILSQTNASNFANPDKFNPDNFLPDACASRHPYTYIPFSGGMRNCIGGKYAMLQMKTVISTLVRKLKFSPSDRCPKPENLRVVYPMLLRFVDGCHVKIEPRT